MLVTTPALGQQQPDKEFILKLSVADINILAKGLGLLPYNEVVSLMQKLQIQINAQNKPPEVSPTQEPKKD